MTHLITYTEEALIPLYRASLAMYDREAPLSKAGRPPPIDDDDSDIELDYHYQDLPPSYELCIATSSQKPSGNRIIHNIKDKIENVKASLSTQNSASKRQIDKKVPQDARTNPME